MPIHDLLHTAFFLSSAAVIASGIWMMLRKAPHEGGSLHKKVALVFLIVGAVYLLTHTPPKFPPLGNHVLSVALIVVAILAFLVFRAVQRDRQKEQSRGDDRK
ncbi:MAG TPA: hypothetical protein H9768_02465 [Candidatus Mailhella merdavium]|nr:hypothetical protein [Candidatus Mailhella merdavium]